ncbi:hypothetical protein PIB30_098260 [Stylosanthes scabra]|uniref:CCHC-type domain-containing protein n=1 Tax=Stylosanthes scabra TaxID=79078 RepID=A0ABU6WUP5_9FABA|nr:hypothetical protein [Stylosanthes scabra]
MKFEAGLRVNIQLLVSPLGIRSFAELVEKCQRVDDSYKRMAVARNDRSNLPPRNFDRDLAPQGRNFKSNNGPFRNFSHGGDSQNHSNNDGNGNQRQGNTSRFLQGQLGQQYQRCERFHGTRPCKDGGSNCYNCGKPEHLARTCRVGKSRPEQDGRQCLGCKGYHGNAPCRGVGIICFTCGKIGHFARDCRVAPSGSGESSQRQPPAGRVYASTMDEAAFSKEPTQERK